MSEYRRLTEIPVSEVLYHGEVAGYNGGSRDPNPYRHGTKMQRLTWLQGRLLKTRGR